MKNALPFKIYAWKTHFVSYFSVLYEKLSCFSFIMMITFLSTWTEVSIFTCMNTQNYNSIRWHSNVKISGTRCFLQANMQTERWQKLLINHGLRPVKVQTWYACYILIFMMRGNNLYSFVCMYFEKLIPWHKKR